jgi:hypothetical protein
MHLDSRIKRNSTTAYRNMEGEGLIMNPADSMLHLLNEVGSSIWEFLQEPRIVRDIVAMVFENFNCDQQTATNDVLEFLQTLQKQQLVEIED